MTHEESVINLADLLYAYPDKVKRILEQEGFAFSSKPTLWEINKVAYVEVFREQNKRVLEKLRQIAQGETYHGFVISAAAIASMIIGGATTAITASQQKESRQQSRDLEVMRLKQQEALTREQIRAAASNERLQILTNSLLATQAQAVALESEKDANVKSILIGLGVGLSVMVVAYILIKKMT